MSWCKGTGKREHIVAHDVSWAAQTGKHLLRTQIVSEQNQKHFLCPGNTKFVSGANVARAGKRGNICVGNNVPSFARAIISSHTKLKGARSCYFRQFCLILSIMSSKRQIGRARAFHLQNQGDITTENDFPAL